MLILRAMVMAAAVAKHGAASDVKQIVFMFDGMYVAYCSVAGCQPCVAHYASLTHTFPATKTPLCPLAPQTTMAGTMSGGGTARCGRLH